MKAAKPAAARVAPFGPGVFWPAFSRAAAANAIVRAGITASGTATQLAHALRQVGLPTDYPADYSPDRVLELMRGDKKSRAGAIEYAIPTRIGVMAGAERGYGVGIVTAAWLAVRIGLAVKPEAYSWRHLCGAGALGGIGFTMSLFIASAAFPDPASYAASKIAIFLASLTAGTLGVLILWPKPGSH